MACPRSTIQPQYARLVTLLEIIANPPSAAHNITFILEEAGRIAQDHCQDMAPEVAQALLPFLDDDSPVVREGAVYGLGYCVPFSQVARVRLMRVGWADPSPGVRDAANEALDD